MKIATDYLRTDDNEQARYWNEKAALLAQQVPDSTIESLARMRLAETLVHLNRRSDALRKLSSGADPRYQREGRPYDWCGLGAIC